MLLVDAGTKNPPLVFNTYIFNEYGFYRNKYLKLMVSSLHARPKTHAIAHLVWNWNGTYSLKIEPPKHKPAEKNCMKERSLFFHFFKQTKSHYWNSSHCRKNGRAMKKNLADVMQNTPRVSAALFLSAIGSCSHLYYVIISIFLPMFHCLMQQHCSTLAKRT